MGCNYNRSDYILGYFDTDLLKRVKNKLAMNFLYPKNLLILWQLWMSDITKNLGGLTQGG